MDKKMNILVSGMGRSGSTVIYNIIKILLTQKYGVIYATLEDGYNEKDCKDVNLMKTHFNEYEGWADIIVTTRRDIRDVISSFKQFKPDVYNNKTKQWTNAFIDWHGRWVNKTNYEVSYEKFMGDESVIINDLAILLGVDNYDIIEIKEIIESLKEIKNINGLYDHNTLIHKKHISKTKGKVGSYKEILTPEEIMIVNETSVSWLKKYKYEI